MHMGVCSHVVTTTPSEDLQTNPAYYTSAAMAKPSENDPVYKLSRVQ